MLSHLFPENSHEVRESIRAGRDGEAVGRVMETYREALLAYLRGSSYHGRFNRSSALTDEDIVQSFMERRVGRENFLREWTSRPARLRFYLLSAFKLYLKGVAREVDRRQLGRLADDDPVADSTPDVARAFAREVARTIVKHAYISVQERALREGKYAYFEAFRRSQLERRSQRQISEEVSGADRNVSHMVRTIQEWLIAEIRDRVGRPGACAGDIDESLRALREALQ